MKTVVFSEGDPKGFEATVREEMVFPVKHFDKELVSIRTGRASTNVIETIQVEAYGQLMPLKELATLSAPEARLLTIQPWDKSVVEAIEKAILASDVGVTPINDGQIIRLQFPMISTERREELVKLLSKKTEDCRIGIRNIRKEFHNQIRKAEREKHISEDFASRLTDLLQKITDEFIKKAEELHGKKAHELRNV